nr:hypothetical protein [Tanacetum cinerariifolium]
MPDAVCLGFDRYQPSVRPVASIIFSTHGANGGFSAGSDAVQEPRSDAFSQQHGAGLEHTNARCLEDVIVDKYQRSQKNRRRRERSVWAAVENLFGEFSRCCIKQADGQHRQQQLRRERNQAKPLADDAIRQGDCCSGNGHCTDQQQPCGSAAVEGFVSTNDEDRQQLGQQRLDEPAAAKQFRRHTGHQVQHPEGRHVEQRTDQPEDHHEVSNINHVPAMRGSLPLAINVVAGNAHGGNVS